MEIKTIKRPKIHARARSFKCVLLSQSRHIMKIFFKKHEYNNLNITTLTLPASKWKKAKITGLHLTTKIFHHFPQHCFNIYELNINLLSI